MHNKIITRKMINLYLYKLFISPSIILSAKKKNDDIEIAGNKNRKKINLFSFDLPWDQN